jgi:hypothetical protein
VAPFIRKKLAITLPTSGGRSVGIVRSRTQTMEFSFLVLSVFFAFHEIRLQILNYQEYGIRRLLLTLTLM